MKAGAPFPFAWRRRHRTQPWWVCGPDGQLGVALPASPPHTCVPSRARIDGFQYGAEGGSVKTKLSLK